jgi:predicted dehydrogenase
MSEAIRRRDVFRAGAAALSAASYSRVLGANDRIHLGVVGCGGRSGLVTGLFQAHADIAVTAVCDVWGDRAEAAAAKAPGAKTTGDHRALLEMKPLDAVLVATPDHWHTAIAIDAMQAGKDVYCEKPLTLRISEGPPVVKAARTVRTGDMVDTFDRRHD